MLSNGVNSGRSFQVYVILKDMEKDRILPNPKILKKLEFFYDRTKKGILDAENGTYVAFEKQG